MAKKAKQATEAKAEQPARNNKKAKVEYAKASDSKVSDKAATLSVPSPGDKAAKITSPVARIDDNPAKKDKKIRDDKKKKGNKKGEPQPDKKSKKDKKRERKEKKSARKDKKKTAGKRSGDGAANQSAKSEKAAERQARELATARKKGELLANQKCVPCRGNVPPLRAKEIAVLLPQLRGWKAVDSHHLEKSLKFSDFASALKFTDKVGELAELEQHHPDIYLAWGKVGIKIWTHKIDGLTESDFILAAKIDQLS